MFTGWCGSAGGERKALFVAGVVAGGGVRPLAPLP